MGTTVKFESVINAIGRELMQRVELISSNNVAVIARKNERADVAKGLIEIVAGMKITDTAKNDFANLIYAFNITQAELDANTIESNAVAINALQQQINDAGSITPEALSTDADGNVDFDIALAAIVAGLDRDEAALVGGAEQALKDAQEKAKTIQALREMALGFTPEML